MSRAQTVTAAVDKRRQADEDGPGALIKRYETDFARVLPTHVKPDTFVRLSQGLLRRNPKLREAAERNPWSFLTSLLDCARLGHEPGTEAYYMVPFDDNKNGTTEVVGIEGYRGQIERMYRAGAVKSVVAEVVRSNDLFDKAQRPPAHEPAYFSSDPPGQNRHPWFASDTERGKLVGVYAYAIMEDGNYSRVVAMGHDEVMRHKAASRAAGSKFSPWNGPFEPAMWLKTAVHELEKWVPTSSEYIRERLRAAVEAERTDDLPDPPPIDTLPGAAAVVDGEVVDAPDPQPGEGSA